MKLMTTRRCKRCKETLDISEFRKIHKHTNWLSYWCGECTLELRIEFHILYGGST